MIKILFNLCPVLKHLVNVHHLSVEIRVVTLLLNNGHIALPLHKLHLFRNLTFLYFAFFQLFSELNIQLFLPPEMALELFVYNFGNVAVVGGAELAL